MEIKYGKQIDINEIDGTCIDLFICAANHESRSYTSFDRITQNNEIKKTIILNYKEDFHVKCNSKKFKRTVAEEHIIKDYNQIFDILNVELMSIVNSRYIIFVDYSCMTKYWYYSIILYLTKRKISLDSIVAYFSYTPSKYSAPLQPKPNSEIAPLPGKYIVPTDKPKALIVCLGYEQNKAEGIIEHLDPKVAYIFYTKPALDDRFVRMLEKNNDNILKERKSNTITFKFDDLLDIERKLTAVYLQLKNDYSVVIAPLGPKPFTFIAMIMSVKYSDIDIWRVGSGSDINEYKRTPIDGAFIVTKIVLT